MKSCGAPETALTSAPLQEFEADASEEFLDVPMLRWAPPSEPYFASRLINLALLDISSSRYSIRVGGKEVGSLWRQHNGTEAYPIVKTKKSEN